jgi:uncharacterized RDD family membrane protein YckC
MPRNSHPRIVIPAKAGIHFDFRDATAKSKSRWIPAFAGMTSKNHLSTRYSSHMIETSKPRTLIGWRLLALLYDFFPALAMWMLVAVPFTVGHTFWGHHDPRDPIPSFSLLWWMLWGVCWLLTGVYATMSWRRGGQTLGMRSWRLFVVAVDGSNPTWRALWLRYAVGTLSLLLGGLGFWWAWFDSEKLTWHDRVSNTRLRRY